MWGTHPTLKQKLSSSDNFLWEIWNLTIIQTNLIHFKLTDNTNHHENHEKETASERNVSCSMRRKHNMLLAKYLNFVWVWESFVETKSNFVKTSFCFFHKHMFILLIFFPSWIRLCIITIRLAVSNIKMKLDDNRFR